MDAQGNLYGTTTSTVFELSPPQAGQTAWTETTLYGFTNGMSGFYSGLVLDRNGNLYGTTPGGGDTGQCGTSGDSGCGTVFELVHPAAGRTTWTEVTLHTFSGGTDGSTPVAGVIMDKTGALYGTTLSGGFASGAAGVAFKLSPPKAGKTVWTETVLHTFTQSSDGYFPNSPLVMDRHGTLYGVTEAGGSGACSIGCGTIFELSPPANGSASWSETTLYDFKQAVTPQETGETGGLLLDKLGNLYGATEIGGAPSADYPGGAGMVFELSPSAGGQSGWTATTLHSFGLTKSDGVWPGAVGLVADKKGHLYGTTRQGGMHQRGTIFSVTP